MIQLVDVLYNEEKQKIYPFYIRDIILFIYLFSRPADVSVITSLFSRIALVGAVTSVMFTHNLGFS